jgi:hypothetical protein
LSWDIFGDQKTVFRVAAGFFYGRTPMLLLNQAFNATGNPEVGVSFTLNGAQIAQAQSVHPEFVYPFVPNSDKASNASYFTAANISGLKPDASFFSPDFKNPRAFNYNVGIERLLMTDLAFSIDWVHANAVYLERIRDANLFPPTVGADNSVPPVQRRIYNTSVRPNTNFNILRSQESSARSNYDGVTITLNKRYSRRFQAQTSYTLAYNRDHDSNERNFAGINYEDAYNLQQEYRWSRNDIRHRWALSGVFDLPGGFTAAPLITWRTGLPFTAFTGTDSNRDSQFTDRPIIGGIPFLRNSYRQPNEWRPDLRVTKTFKFSDRHQLTFNADLFNFLNLDNFKYRVSTNESSTTALGSRWGTGQTPLPTFMTIRLADGTLNQGGAEVGTTPFQLQMSLRYVF